jgi:hypothetical protein
MSGSNPKWIIAALAISTIKDWYDPAAHIPDEDLVRGWNQIVTNGVPLGQCSQSPCSPNKDWRCLPSRNWLCTPWWWQWWHCTNADPPLDTIYWGYVSCGHNVRMYRRKSYLSFLLQSTQDTLSRFFLIGHYYAFLFTLAFEDDGVVTWHIKAGCHWVANMKKGDYFGVYVRHVFWG